MFHALQKWRDARQHLDAAVQSYVGSLVALDRSLRVNFRTTDANSLKIISLEAEHDLSSLHDRRDALLNGKHVLNKIRNMSSPAPTNKIPSEILLEIFQHCALKHPNPYYDPLLCSGEHFSLPQLFHLSHVCTDWRTIITTASSFWSHVDMETLDRFSQANAHNCIQLSLQRSRDRPLCFEFEFPYPGDQHRALLSAVFLLPHINRLQSVYLGECTDVAELVDFFSHWFGMTNAPTGTIRNLVLWSNPDCREFDEPAIFNPSGNQADDILLFPIQVLRLNGVAFEWRSSAYRNLAHLHIGSLPFEISPSLDEMIDVLNACPELHTLQLTEMWVAESKRPQLQPVALNNLRILDMCGLYHESVGLLLPLLSVPRANALSFKSFLHPSTRAACSAVQAFLARSNVTRLALYTAGSESLLEKYLAMAQGLTVLILELYANQGSLVTALAQIPFSICPKIHTLYLYNGAIREATLHKLIKIRPAIRKLRVVECNMEEFEESIKRLQSLVPDTGYYDASATEVDIRWYDIMT